MKKILFSFIIFGVVSFFFTCGKSPVNPYSDYGNAESFFISPPQDSLVFFVGDSIKIKIKTQAVSLFDSLVFSINGKDSTLSIDSFNWVDTVVVKLIYMDPDTIRLKIKADLKNKSALVDSMAIVIKGKSTRIMKDLPEILSVELGAACSLSITASGTGPIFYQWVKDGKGHVGNSTELVFINFQAKDTGNYFCIAMGEWGNDTSTVTRLSVKKKTDRPVFWHFAVFRDTVFEGDSLFIRVDSLYTIPANDSTILKTLVDMKQISFKGDSLFIFKAGARDSGSYWIPVEVATKSGKDTSSIVVDVRPRYYVLTRQADSGGTIKAFPSVGSFRLGDTVSLAAVPKTGFLFAGWLGDATGNDTLIKIKMVKHMTIKAAFIAQSSSGCMVLNGGSLNKAIRDASPGAVRPMGVCPEEGIYDQGTIKIWGKVKFSFEK